MRLREPGRASAVSRASASSGSSTSSERPSSPWSAARSSGSTGSETRARVGSAADERLEALVGGELRRRKRRGRVDGTCGMAIVGPCGLAGIGPRGAIVLPPRLGRGAGAPQGHPRPCCTYRVRDRVYECADFAPDLLSCRQGRAAASVESSLGLFEAVAASVSTASAGAADDRLGVVLRANGEST